MDNISAKIDSQQTIRSPPRRRRSTFFERRDSIAPQQKDETSIIEVDNQRKEDLLRYHDQLLSEKEQWKREYSKRRNKYHDLRQQCHIASGSSSLSMCYSVLTSEDIDFINAKVNISKIIDSQQKLHKSLKQTQAFYRKASDLNEVLLKNCENKVDEVTNYVLENSHINTVD